MSRFNNAYGRSDGGQGSALAIEQDLFAEPQIVPSINDFQAPAYGLPEQYLDAQVPYSEPGFHDQVNQQEVEISSAYEFASPYVVPPAPGVDRNFYAGSPEVQDGYYAAENNHVAVNNADVRYIQQPEYVAEPVQTVRVVSQESGPKSETIFEKIDQTVMRWMSAYALRFTQASLGLIFIWFGILKFFPGMSPAEGLVMETSDQLFSLVGLGVPSKITIVLLAVWELTIGFGIFLNMFKKPVVLMIILHMPSTALPFVLLPGVVWAQFPFALTLEGQYIVKNLIIIGGAMAIGATARDTHSVPE